MSSRTCVSFSLQNMSCEGEIVHSPLRSDSINLVNEDDTWCVLLSHTEELADELGPVSEVLLNQLGADYPEECRRSLVCDGFSEKRLPCSWDTVEDDTLWWLDTHLLVELRMCKWQLDGFLCDR